MHYLKLKKFSIGRSFYFFVDVEDYLADQLFIKHKVRVTFKHEYRKDGEKYLIIVCSVRKNDEKNFITALEELPQKMAILGYTDYSDFCDNKLAPMLSNN